MFEEKGISTSPEDFPKTWDELRALSKEFTVWEDGVLKQAGFLPLSYTGSYYSMAVQYAAWAAVNGTQIYDADNKKFTLTTPENIEVLAYALDWLDEEYKGDLVTVQASGNWHGYADDEGRPPGFTEGRLASIVNGYWYTADMYAHEMKFERWNVANFPVGPSGTGTSSGYWPNWLVIPTGSKNMEEAFAYLDYMAVEGIQVWFQNIPDLPTNALVPDGLLPSTVVEKRGEEFAKEMNAFFEHQLEIATPMWNSPIHDFALDQLGRAIEQVLGKAQGPESALTEAQNACTAELDRVLTN
jgi:ABC-type glycerol-3-phosphate transport system substrate-binding protein